MRAIASFLALARMATDNIKVRFRTVLLVRLSPRVLIQLLLLM